MFNLLKNIVLFFLNGEFLKELFSFGFVAWILLVVVGAAYVMFKPLIEITVSIAKNIYCTYKINSLKLNNALENKNNVLESRLAAAGQVPPVQAPSIKQQQATTSEERVQYVSSENNKSLDSMVEPEAPSAFVDEDIIIHGQMDCPFPEEDLFPEENLCLNSEPVELFEEFEAEEDEHENIEEKTVGVILEGSDSEEESSKKGKVILLNKKNIENINNENSTNKSYIVDIENVTIRNAEFIAIAHIKEENIEINLNQFGIEMHEIESGKLKLILCKEEVVSAEPVLASTGTN